MNFPSLIDDAERRGLEQGRREERRLLTEKLIAEGWDPRRAASFTGLAV